MSLELALDACQWGTFLGVALLVGSQIYLQVVWWQHPGAPALGRWQLAGSILVVVAAAAQMVLTAYLMTEQPTWSDIVGLADAHPGFVLCSRMGLAVALWGALRLPWPVPRRWLGGSLALTLLASLTAVSHAYTAGGWLPMAMDGLHVAAMAGWMGLLFFYAVQGGPADDTGAVERLSAGALTCVLLLAISGSYAVWIHVPTLRAVVDTPYGRTLLWKGGALTLALAVAGYNRWRLVGSHAVTALRRSVAIEAVIVAVVLLVTALLTRTDLPPGI